MCNDYISGLFIVSINYTLYHYKYAVYNVVMVFCCFSVEEDLYCPSIVLILIKIVTLPPFLKVSMFLALIGPST